MASLGWDVLATDVHYVVNTVLEPNIRCNASSVPGVIQVRELDWTISPQAWVWNHPNIVASSNAPPPTSSSRPLLGPPFDLIITADTLYSPDLIQPLLRSLHALCILSMSSTGKTPPILLCLERRDPVLVDRALREAQEDWNLIPKRVPHHKLLKAMKRGGADWTKEDWEGVELWKLTYHKKMEAQPSLE